jgi:aminocarboxymuconate-semialdehyde decarboxylase
LKIDLHAHVVPRDCFEMEDSAGHKHGIAIKKNAAGQEVLPSGRPIAPRCDAKTIIENMDKVGLDMRAISMYPGDVLYNVPPNDGLMFARKQNDALAGMVDFNPKRLIGFATVPMQDMSLAVPEMDRAVKELGYKGFAILAGVNKKNLDDPEFAPFYSKVQELDVPIFVHPRGGQMPGADQMKGYFLENIVVNPLDTTLAIARIVFGGVLESFPRLRFVFAHAGGYVPFIRGRWEQGYQFIKECKTIPKPPGEYIKLMYFDTVIHFGPALSYLVDTVGPDHVVLGTDYEAPMGIFDPVAQVRNSAGISAADKEKILEETSLAVLKMK